MPGIKLENITKRWGKFFGVDNISLDIPDNSFVTLLGPSGCGKTTLLRMIAGLETPTEGRITIGDRVVFDSNAGINVPANKRKVGFLFQNYALWPNMTVYENISFGLKNINEELPVLDDEAKQTADIARALANGKRIREIVGECVGKNGKLDEKKAQVKLIDNYNISVFSAKELLGLGIHTAADPAAAAKTKLTAYEEKLAAIKAHYQAEGKELNDRFEVTKGGKPVVEKRKLSKEEIDSKVRACARIVKIGMFMDRYPAELSGGQQQRVAIARTLAPEPQVLFMDEPLSNLDAKLRLEMRYELQRLHVETGSTFVYVTHDQMEAMTLATRICLINNGVLQQYDAPLTVYSRPGNLFVADFVGNPSINFVEGKGTAQSDGSVSLDIFDGVKARFAPSEPLNMAEWKKRRNDEADKKAAETAKRLSQKGAVEKANKDEVFKYHVQKVTEEDESVADEIIPTEEDYVIGIRPEAVKLSADGKLASTIYGAMPTGMESTLKLRIGEYLITGVVFGNDTYAIGSDAKVSISGNDILLFDRISGNLICAGSLEL
ncbi:MAG: ABC transporter ATP-binding protein [Lachnospiraceae bacterium]|nr:ABC transporter ATP-binding protein [Lachnospiraceae bacterium]